MSDAKKCDACGKFGLATESRWISVVDRRGGGELHICSYDCLATYAAKRMDETRAAFAVFEPR